MSDTTDNNTKAMTDEQLDASLTEAVSRQIKIRVNTAVDKHSTAELKNLRKVVARLKTEVRRRELAR